MALQTDEIQIAYNLKTENLADFEGNDNVNIQKLESLRSTYAFMNENGALGDIKLRQALLRGLDKDTTAMSFSKAVQHRERHLFLLHLISVLTIK